MYRFAIREYVETVCIVLAASYCFEHKCMQMIVN